MCTLTKSLFAAAALCAGAVPAFAAAPDDLINLRAIQPLPTEAVRAIAEFGAPRVLGKSDYPDAKRFSAKHIIDVLCGSYREGYWQATVKLNGLDNLNPTRVLGEKVYSIKWPACAYVFRPTKNIPLLVYNKTTAADLYKELTGGKGSENSIRYYFRNSAVADVSKIAAGATLVPAHVTLAQQIKVADKGGFFAAVNSATFGKSDKFLMMADVPEGTSSTSPQPARVTQPAPPARTKLMIAAGRIEGVQGPYQSPPECKSTVNTPALEVERILAAYDLSRRAAIRRHLDQYPTDVFVADNGFFGAKRTPARIQFGANFPDTFFYTADRYSDGQIGPLIRSTQQAPIYPLNYSNDLSTPTFVSGHGTHVVGLVLGGALFHSHLNYLQRPGGQPWLHVIVLNIGKGGAELLPGSEQQLDTQVELLKNKIVNLSLEYDDNVDQSVQSIFSKMMLSGEQNQNLFVVAAGNDSASDVSIAPYYPAAFGGDGLGGQTSNVISVAAHRPDGSLAAFTNRGANSIDIAAPGCDLGSWIDDSAQVVTLSGTSQAAAVVTFAAALVRSLGNFDPYSIKGRLMISGDLLKPSAPVTLPAVNPMPAEIMSRSRLNVSTALYVFDDYVRYRLPGDTADREVLGQVDGLTGVGCEGGREIDWSDVWAFKAEASAAWLYKGRKSKAVRAPCKGFIASTATMSMHIRAVLGPGGAVEREAPAAQVTPIPMSSVRMYVAAMPSAQP